MHSQADEEDNYSESYDSSQGVADDFAEHRMKVGPIASSLSVWQHLTSPSLWPLPLAASQQSDR